MMIKVAVNKHRIHLLHGNKLIKRIIKFHYSAYFYFVLLLFFFYIHTLYNICFCMCNYKQFFFCVAGEFVHIIELSKLWF